ncbi:MAG: hypothetical protein QOJ79_397 [Actinomycetota bacterium]|nr:hypothetical protein [Actinomycetota bacterium]
MTRIPEVVDQATQRLDPISERAVRRILSALPSYQSVGTVAIEDLRQSVRRNIEAVLDCLRDGRLLGDQELAGSRELGTRRAQQDMPVTDVMRAFRVGYVELWEELLAIASGIGHEAEIELLQAASLVWTTLDQISSAVAEAHRETVARVETDTRRLALSLLEGLRRFPVDHDGTTEIARQLGMDPSASFLIAVYAGHPHAVALPDSLVVEGPQQSVVVQQPGVGAVAAEAGLLGALVAAELRRAGVGLLLPGVEGAAASLRQAERALAVSAGCGEPVSFRQEWLPALALAQLADVLGVLGPAVDHLRDDESLRATVSAYLSNNGQLAAAGAQLFVHPNTVAYRLGRFAERTGVDPRTSDGALSTRLALRLSQLTGA